MGIEREAPLLMVSRTEVAPLFPRQKCNETNDAGIGIRGLHPSTQSRCQGVVRIALLVMVGTRETKRFLDCPATHSEPSCRATIKVSMRPPHGVSLEPTRRGTPRDFGAW